MASKLRVVPGIGFLGLGQMDAANQLVFSQALGRNGGGGGKRRGGKRRRRTTPARRGQQGAGGRFGRIKRQVARARRASRPARMVKGSAAAKRHMAKLRRMRK